MGPTVYSIPLSLQPTEQNPKHFLAHGQRCDVSTPETLSKCRLLFTHKIMKSSNGERKTNKTREYFYFI